MTQEERNRQDELAEFISKLSKKIKKFTKEDFPVQININMSNTGITEGPSDSNQWKHYYDLGGRFVNLEIEFPNKITLAEAIKAPDREKPN